MARTKACKTWWSRWSCRIARDSCGWAPRTGCSDTIAGEATSVYVDSAGTVWYGCARHLCRIENGRGRDVGTESGLPAEEWDAILGDLDGNLWVRSEQSLYLRQSGSTRFQLRGGL